MSTTSASLTAPVAHGGAGGGEFGVGNAGLRAGARLDRDVGAEPFHLLDRFRRRGDPILAPGRPHARRQCAFTRLLVTGDLAEPGVQPPEVSASAISETTTMTTLGSLAPVAKPWMATHGRNQHDSKATSQ